MDYILFELNCGYYLKISYKDETDLYLKSHFTNKLAKELRELMEICYQNLLHI